MFSKGYMKLFLTFGKKVTLTNVLHVLDINRNIGSRDLLGKLGIKSMYELGKLILSRNKIFIGKGYSTDGIVKLYTINNINNNNNNNVSSTYS